MPRTRVSLNSKVHQLGWLKTKKFKKPKKKFFLNFLHYYLFGIAGGEEVDLNFSSIGNVVYVLVNSLHANLLKIGTGLFAEVSPV